MGAGEAVCMRMKDLNRRLEEDRSMRLHLKRLERAVSAAE